MKDQHPEATVPGPTILDEIDPELGSAVVSRRAAIVRGVSVSSAIAAGLAMASVPVTLAALAKDVFAQGTALPANIVDVLNFALTLEFLESTFYTMGLGKSGLIPASDIAIFQQISKHETAHVAFLQSVLGSSAVAKPTFDFTAKGKYADVFSNYDTFKAVSQAFEDTGVRAYKGQAPNLMSDATILTAALQIHSVEARHAAEVRRLRGLKGWITGRQNDIPGADAVYGPGNPASQFPAEDNTVQDGINLASVITGCSPGAVSEAFDEPLDKGTVLAIAGQFIVS
jgi:hypothetical protein